jgi:hypothetical protein
MSYTENMSAGHSAMAAGCFDEASDRFAMSHQAGRYARRSHRRPPTPDASREPRRPSPPIPHHLTLWTANQLTRDHPDASSVVGHASDQNPEYQ